MRETKIVQVYPSDYAIERAIKEWESFGWEMTDNQRISNKEDLWFPGGTTVRTTTCNKLTFSREKSSPWYLEVKRLEEEYEGVQRRISSIKMQKPQNSDGLLNTFLSCITIWLPVPIISFIVYKIIKKVRFKKALKRYKIEYTEKLDDLNSQADNLRYAASNIVNAQ